VEHRFFVDPSSGTPQANRSRFNMKIVNTLCVALALVVLSGHLADAEPARSTVGQGSADESTESSRAAAAFITARDAAVERASERAARATAVSITDNWWDTRAGQLQYARLQLEALDKDLAQLDELGVQPWPALYESSSGSWTIQDLEDRSKGLEDAVSGIVDFLEWQLGVKAPAGQTPPQEDDVRVRLEQIQETAAIVRLNVPAVISGAALDVAMLIQVLEDLANIRSLASSLRN
jgi:hypothetical protein